jgi:hypothetical protein
VSAWGCDFTTPYPVPDPDPLEELRRSVAIARERMTSLIALLIAKGVLTPDDAGFVDHSTGNAATLNQPDPEPYSGVPTGGA